MTRPKTVPRNRDARSAGRPRGPGGALSPLRAGWSVSRDVVSQRLDDEVVLVQLKTDRVYALNHTAARFWELLASKKTLGAIERKLAEEFEVGGERLRKSIERLLSALHSRKLVRRTGKAL